MMITRLNIVFCKVYLFFKKVVYLMLYSKGVNSERIIVSMTSWPKRINNIPIVIESILHNSVKPDKIILNLSLVEFPNREYDLPIEILAFIEKGVIDIEWQEGNAKAFKKIIPTLQKYPNDVIISIDDDFIYPADFIETFVRMHKKYPNNPLSGNEVVIFGVKAHCGCASLVKSQFFDQYLEKLLDEDVVEIGTDDVFYTICATLAGYSYKYVGKEFFLNMEQINAVEGISDCCVKENQFNMLKYVNSKTIEKFNIDIGIICSPRFKFR